MNPDLDFRTSSHCSGSNCVEIAFQKSSHCSTGTCVEVGYETSSFCGSSACVEVDRHTHPDVHVRDGKNREGATLTFSRDEWATFIQTIKGGDVG